MSPTIHEAPPLVAAAARAYFTAEIAEDTARQVYYSSRGMPDEGATTSKHQATLHAAQKAWTALRNAMPYRWSDQWFECDGRLFGWTWLGERAVFRVRSAEASGAMRRKVNANANHEF